MKRYVSENVVSLREPKEIETIYKLLLHETMAIETGIADDLFTSVMRVPGGFIYRSFDKGNKMMSCVFVPFNNEWMNNEKLK